MNGLHASFLPDGSCRYLDELEDTEVTWRSVHDWALDWFAEQRADNSGVASEFIHAACDDAAAGVVAALVVLAEVAGGDEDLLGWVGAGPVEDLVSHSGNALLVLEELHCEARRNTAFRAALRNVWLGADVPKKVRERLTEFGAQDLTAT